MATSRRDEAHRLAEQLLDDIELSRIPPMEVARKTSRLARLVDDAEAMEWLRHETGGYLSVNNELPPPAWNAAIRSNRTFQAADGSWKALTPTLGQIQANIDASLAQLAAAVDRPVSLSSANPSQFVTAPGGNTVERANLRNFIGSQQELLDKVLGALHQYVSEQYQQLRFGAAVETAFETVRSQVDAAIGSLIPDGLPKLTAALENAASNNPEQWANAAAGCRRLLKAAADALRPPGPPVDGHAMDDDHYINRLVAWILEQADSETSAAIVEADLQYLDQRLHAAANAGHKGAHAEVTRVEASRYVTGTYLVLGDILRLRKPEDGEAPQHTGEAADNPQPAPIDAGALPESSASAGDA